MVCTVVLSVVQDRHGYEVWISRCRHVAASCLITIFVIFCHETDFQSPSLRSALAERAGRDLELRREKSSRVRFDSNSTIQTSLSPLPPSSSPIPRSSNRSIDRCYDFLTSIRVDDSLCYLNCIYIWKIWNEINFIQFLFRLSWNFFVVIAVVWYRSMFISRIGKFKVSYRWWFWNDRSNCTKKQVSRIERSRRDNLSNCQYVISWRTRPRVSGFLFITDRSVVRRSTFDVPRLEKFNYQRFRGI